MPGGHKRSKRGAIRHPYEHLPGDRVRPEEVALGYYEKRNVSVGYCAEIAGLSEEEFIAFLGQNEVDIFQFESDDELLRYISNA